MAREMPMKLARERDAVYFTDMSQCLPAASLSPGKEENRWRLIPYRTSRLQAPIKDLYVMKPDLTIVDCVYALITNGPAGPGKTEELNTVVASTDPVAADSYTVGIARWYNRDWKGTQVKYIKNAYDLGFGEIDVAKMDVKEV